MSYSEELEPDRRHPRRAWSRDWHSANERLHLAERTVPGWLVDVCGIGIAIALAVAVVWPFIL